MKVHYCLPIIKTKTADVLQLILDNEKEYQYFEVWIDYIEDIDERFLSKITNLLGSKLLLLFRRQDLMPPTMNHKKRLDLLLLLSKSESLIDLDITQQEELNFIKQHTLPVKLITSYHNYKQTPSDDVLRKTIMKMHHYQPEIYKIATLCQTEQDALRLLALQQALKQQKKKHIVLGMGKYGTITRIFGSLWGNEMIFAPKEKSEASAPGQLTKKQLEIVFEKLNASG